MEFSMNKIIKLLIEKIWIIILIIIVCGMSTFIISKYLIKPKYESSVEFLVDKSSTSADASTSELTYAKTIVANYMKYIKSQAFLDMICIKLNANQDSNIVYTTSEIKDYISTVASSDNATTFVVTITANSSKIAYEICNVIAVEGPALLKEFDPLKESVACIINNPEENIDPVSPNIFLYTFLGFLIGAIVAFSLIIIIDRLDNSIKDETDLIENYDIPLIGVVYTHRINKDIIGATK